MADPVQFDWAERAWEVGRILVGALATAASSVVLYFGRRGMQVLGKVDRHEERLDAAESELGLNKAHRETCGKAPMGDALAKELQRLRDEDDVLHGRVNKQARMQNRQNARVNEKLGRIETNIEWLCRELGREDCDTK